MDISWKTWALLSNPRKRILLATFCVAFYSFLPTLLLHEDIPLATSQARIIITVSKTDPFRKSCTVTLSATNTCTFPVVALRKYLDCADLQPDSPLFQFQNGTFLTRTALTAKLSVRLQLAGCNSDTFASHSFRIGAATTTASAGLPVWLIQTMGRCTSDVPCEGKTHSCSCLSSCIGPSPILCSAGFVRVTCTYDTKIQEKALPGGMECDTTNPVCMWGTPSSISSPLIISTVVVVQLYLPVIKSDRRLPESS